MASSVGNVADSTGTSVPFYLGRHPFGVWRRFVFLITTFPLTIPITSVALLSSRVLPSDRVWCCRPFRKYFLVVCLHLACLHFACFGEFFVVILSHQCTSLLFETLLGTDCIGISPLFLSPSQLLSPSIPACRSLPCASTFSPNPFPLARFGPFLLVWGGGAIST